MAGQIPEPPRHSGHTYNDRTATITALLAALLLDAAIIGLFMFITWLAYATD